jgi:3-carboxy-cis,cis-muconate cycloisomerase
MLTQELFVDPVVARCFGARATLQAMLDFETALARAEAAAGVIPAAAVAPIEAAADAEGFDVAEIAREAASAGNVAIPLVKALTARVAARDPQAARYVHWGATSQDVLDTGLVLQLRVALTHVAGVLAGLDDALAALSVRHIDTVMVARTWLQQATPTTFGRKAAGWLAAIRRTRGGLERALHEASVVQFGGASGTLAALGERGLDVGERLARELDLALPALPWHAERDRLCALAAACANVAGILGKIARDVSLLAQSEVAEAAEPAAPGRGGSSTMPQKRNPVACAVALAAAVRAPGLAATMFAAMAQEHERGLGGWHAEWETLPDLVRIVSGSAHAMAGALAGLAVDPARMRANLEATQGFAMAEAFKTALAGAVGLARAHDIVEAASRSAAARGCSLREALETEPDVRAHLTAEALDRAGDPHRYLGAAAEFVRRSIAEPARRGIAEPVP